MHSQQPRSASIQSHAQDEAMLYADPNLGGAAIGEQQMRTHSLPQAHERGQVRACPATIQHDLSSGHTGRLDSSITQTNPRATLNTLPPVRVSSANTSTGTATYVDPFTSNGSGANDHRPVSLPYDQSRHSYDAPLHDIESAHGGRPLHLSSSQHSTPAPQAQSPELRGPWFFRPWQTVFERPSFSNAGLLIIACAVAYALIALVPTQVTKAVDLNLYWVRAIVTATIVVAGFIVSVPLTEISFRMLYSAIWTAVLLEDDFTLDDLDKVADQVGVMSGFRLLWIRLRAGSKRAALCKGRPGRDNKDSIRGAVARVRRVTWGIEVLASLGLLFIARAFSFAADRTLRINTEMRPQTRFYDAVSVGGDLSDTDLAAAAALRPAFENFDRTWTLQSIAALKLPSIVKLALPDHRDQFAYFTEVLSDHFDPHFQGYGSFNEFAINPVQGRSWSAEAAAELAQKRESNGSGNSPTFVVSEADGTTPIVRRRVRWPRWGVQTRCQRLENLAHYFVPDVARNKPNATVPNRTSALFLTRETLTSILGMLDVPLPSTLQAPLNLSTPALVGLDAVLPPGLSASHVAAAKKFGADGVAQSFWSTPFRAEVDFDSDASTPHQLNQTAGSAGPGWISLEVVLVRLKPDLAGPAAQFGMTANVTDSQGSFNNVGMDVGICVQRFDPYIVEVYQGRSIQSTTILNQSATLQPSEEAHITSVSLAPGTASSLSSLGKFSAYIVAHENARNALIKDNGRDYPWVPNPTVIAMSSGGDGGPAGYGTLDPERLADMLASADSRLLLPYLVGSGKVEAHSYLLKQIARVSCIFRLLNLAFGALIGSALLCILFVPRLPAGLPRRSTSPISWLASLSGPGCLRIGGVPADALSDAGRHRSAGPARGSRTVSENRKSTASFAPSAATANQPMHGFRNQGGKRDGDWQRYLKFRRRTRSGGGGALTGAWVFAGESQEEVGQEASQLCPRGRLIGMSGLRDASRAPKKVSRHD
ncbi:hypothetical protein V8E36_001760 [Tilletia maclaganii]